MPSHLHSIPILSFHERRVGPWPAKSSQGPTRKFRKYLELSAAKTLSSLRAAASRSFVALPVERLLDAVVGRRLQAGDDLGVDLVQDGD